MRQTTKLDPRDGADDSDWEGSGQDQGDFNSSTDDD